MASLGIVLVSLTDTIATSTSFAARRGDDVNPNQEMIGMGGANIAAGLFQGFAISASGSRTAVAEQSGSKSQVTGLAGAAVVVVLLLFLPSLLQNLPQPALAAVVIVAALSLFSLGILRKYSRVRRTALVISLVTSLGVILFGVLEGILIAVILSILLFFRRSWWPEGEVLGRVDDLDGWHSVDRYPESREVDDILVYRWEAPLFFANAGIFRQEIHRLVKRRKPQWVVLQCEAITDVDVTAADMLVQLDKDLNSQGVSLVCVEMRSRLEDLLESYGLFATLTREHVYPSIDMALSGIEQESRTSASDPSAAPETPGAPA